MDLDVQNKEIHKIIISVYFFFFFFQKFLSKMEEKQIPAYKTWSSICTLELPHWKKMMEMKPMKKWSKQQINRLSTCIFNTVKSLMEKV